MNIWQQNYFENGLEKETKMSLKQITSLKQFTSPVSMVYHLKCFFGYSTVVVQLLRLVFSTKTIFI